MKPLILPIVSGLVALSLVFGNVSHAQVGGTITFANDSSCKIISGQTSNPVSSTNGVQAALYWAPINSASFTQVGTNVAVGIPVSGIFAAGTYTINPGVQGGQLCQVQVRAWGGGHSTYENALIAGALAGTSVVVQVTTGNPLGDPPTAPASLVAGGLQSFSVNPGIAIQPLTLTCASNKSIVCGTAWSFDLPSVSGGCGSTTLTVLSTVTNGSCPQKLTRTWQATDGCVTLTCSQTVTNEDVTPPVIVCASNKTVTCGSVWAFDAPSALDACSGTNLTLVVVETVTNGVCPQTIKRTWLASDPCGNTNSCSQTVTNLDITPPQLTCNSNKAVNCGEAWAFDPPAAQDDCSGSVVITILGTSTNGLCPRVVTRTWQATDGCGNTNSCSQSVTVLDMATPSIVCASNKMVYCTNAWDFDPPTASIDCAETGLIVTVQNTVTNTLCPLQLTRSWNVSTPCATNIASCSQTVLVLCDCPALLLAKQCPPYPVPPGGTLTWTGSITNTSDVALTNVWVKNDQPAPNTIVFGPVTLAPGQGAVFGSSYAVCSCGPHSDTLTAVGSGPFGIMFSNSISTSCVGTNSVTPGDMNGDGIVDQSELNAVLANYWAHSPLVSMTNAARLCEGKFQFELTNTSAWNFTVLVSTNLVNWTNLLSPAYPVFQFVDPESSNAPQRFYRLQWP